MSQFTTIEAALDRLAEELLAKGRAELAAKEEHQLGEYREGFGRWASHHLGLDGQNTALIQALRAEMPDNPDPSAEDLSGKLIRRLWHRLRERPEASR